MSDDKVRAVMDSLGHLSAKMDASYGPRMIYGTGMNEGYVLPEIQELEGAHDIPRGAGGPYKTKAEARAAFDKWSAVYDKGRKTARGDAAGDAELKNMTKADLREAISDLKYDLKDAEGSEKRFVQSELTKHERELASRSSTRGDADERWSFQKWSRALKQEAERVGETVDEKKLAALYEEKLSVREALGRMNKNDSARSDAPFGSERDRQEWLQKQRRMLRDLEGSSDPGSSERRAELKRRIEETEKRSSSRGDADADDHKTLWQISIGHFEYVKENGKRKTFESEAEAEAEANRLRKQNPAARAVRYQ